MTNLPVGAGRVDVSGGSSKNKTVVVVKKVSIS